MVASRQQTADKAAMVEFRRWEVLAQQVAAVVAALILARVATVVREVVLAARITITMLAELKLQGKGLLAQQTQMQSTQGLAEVVQVQRAVPQAMEMELVALAELVPLFSRVLHLRAAEVDLVAVQPTAQQL